MKMLHSNTIVIPGVPVSQARMKHRRIGNFVSTYDPKAKEKQKIRELLGRLLPSIHSYEYPRISFLFYMPIPASIPKKLRSDYESGLLKHDKKPDVDNLIKLYLDCIDGIAIQGDQKVSLGPCIKLYHPEPRTIIHIQETIQQLAAWETDISLFSS